MSAPKDLCRPSRITVWGLAEAAGMLFCAATVTGFFGRLWWLLELTVHFRPHLATALALLAGIWAWRRRWRWALLYGSFAAMNAVVLLPCLWPVGRAVAADGTRLRLVALNVHTANQRTDLVLDFLRAAKPDVILLMEVDDRWMRALHPLRGTHPHQVAAPREDNFGIALFSRVPWKKAETIELGGAEVPSVMAVVPVGASEVLVVGTHPLPPVTAQQARERNQQLQAVAAFARRQSPPVVLVGDLNTTPWSPYFSALLRESGLSNAAQGWGLAGSWPAGLAFGRILLDHCLVSPSIRVLDRHLGPPVGSDHLPLVVDLQLPARVESLAAPTGRPDRRRQLARSPQRWTL